MITRVLVVRIGAGSEITRVLVVRIGAGSEQGL